MAPSTIGTISTQTLTYAPAILAGVQAAEQSTVSGADKKQAVVNAVIAGARAAEGVPNPQVAGIATLIDLFISILNATGVFSHKSAPAPAV
jgi:hypothetical protein